MPFTLDAELYHFLHNPLHHAFVSIQAGGKLFLSEHSLFSAFEFSSCQIDINILGRKVEVDHLSLYVESLVFS
jgi:hypothetical protein